MDNIYMLADTVILSRIGSRVRRARLKQNITQQSLAEFSGVSLSSLKKIENGKIGSFESFLRVLRTLGMLDMLQSLTEEEQLSPNEYYNLVHSAKKNTRKRAAGQLTRPEKKESEW